MGKQIRFYMMPEDEEAFVAFLRTTGDIRIIPHAWRGPDVPNLASLPDLDSDGFAWSLSLFNADVSRNLVIEYIERQGYYIVDELRASVIEFSRSTVQVPELSLGRLHIETYILEHGEMRRKEPEFERWYDRLVRWIRKNYEKGEYCWVGPEASKFQRAGGKLVQFLSRPETHPTTTRE